MDKTLKKRRFFTFMIVPHDAQGRPLSLKLPASWLYTAAALAIFSVILVFSSIVYSTLISRRLVSYSETLNKNQKQQEIITSFSAKTQKVDQAIDELHERDNELRKMLGLKQIKTKPIGPKSAVDFNGIDAKIAEQKQSLTELKSWVELVQSRFASTPSIWPTYGRLVSFFGYRSYPWRGLHTGVDIDVSYGSPARAAAAGTVTFVGWRQGYGKTVEISHGFGISTLYAHNSGYAVNIGQKVKKGQVICYVGRTGWTTGPHLHYEVRRWDRPVNPMAYLNLNLLSASKIWSGGKI